MSDIPHSGDDAENAAWSVSGHDGLVEVRLSPDGRKPFSLYLEPEQAVMMADAMVGWARKVATL